MDYQASSAPFASIGRSILSIRRDQYHPTSEDQQDQELESFQKHVADLFSGLSSILLTEDHPLSIAWLRRLLDTFLICQEEFRVIFFNSKHHLSKPPIDRIVNDFFERMVKALDVCNAIRDGIDQIRQWNIHVSMVISALTKERRVITEGQIRRAKKVLAELAILVIDEKDCSATGGSILPYRNRSFGRNNNLKADHLSRKGHFRSFSWSVSRSWSASKQIQAIGSNLNAPRGNEITQTNGLAVPVYTMSSVLLFVMWSLVAAIPCQDRGLQTHFSIPRNFAWASAVLGMHEKIMEESKKKERKGSSGLLKEVHLIEKCVRNLSEVLDSASVPMEEEKMEEVRGAVKELEDVFKVLEEELEPLERQVKEAFFRIVRSRTEGLDCMGKSHGGE